MPPIRSREGLAFPQDVPHPSKLANPSDERHITCCGPPPPPVLDLQLSHAVNILLTDLQLRHVVEHLVPLLQL